MHLNKTALRLAVTALASSAAAIPAAARIGPERVGITVGTLGNPFFVPLVKGAEDAIKAVPPIPISPWSAPITT